MLEMVGSLRSRSIMPTPCRDGWDFVRRVNAAVVLMDKVVFPIPPLGPTTEMIVMNWFDPFFYLRLK